MARSILRSRPVRRVLCHLFLKNLISVDVDDAQRSHSRALPHGSSPHYFSNLLKAD